MGTALRLPNREKVQKWPPAANPQRSRVSTMAIEIFVKASSTFFRTNSKYKRKAYSQGLVVGACRSSHNALFLEKATDWRVRVSKAKRKPNRKNNGSNPARLPTLGLTCQRRDHPKPLQTTVSPIVLQSPGLLLSVPATLIGLRLCNLVVHVATAKLITKISSSHRVMRAKGEGPGRLE